jgi:hypothetical protein
MVIFCIFIFIFCLFLQGVGCDVVSWHNYFYMW